MKKAALCASLVVIAAGTLGLATFLSQQASPQRQTRLPTTSLIRDIGSSYENYLADGGDPSGLHSLKELVHSLTGHNPRDILYMGVTKDSLDKDGQVVDAWGSRLEMRRMDGAKIEIRSAGKDGVPGTADDIVSVYPRDQEARR